MVQCTKCKKYKKLERFSKRGGRTKRHAWCKECISKNSLEFLKYKRLLCIEHYSNKKFECNCCGEKNIKFLTIDHSNNDGAKHRREVHHSGLCGWLIRNNFPSGFQILCINCNWARAHNKEHICPHKMKPSFYNDELEFLETFRNKQPNKKKEQERLRLKKKEEGKILAEKNRISKRKYVHPSPEELKKLISKNSISEIGRTFGVSHNAIKKLARKYGLVPPAKKKTPLVSQT